MTAAGLGGDRARQHGSGPAWGFPGQAWPDGRGGLLDGEAAAIAAIGRPAAQPHRRPPAADREALEGTGPAGGSRSRIRQPRPAWQAREAIIGLVHLADILTDSPSPWAITGWYHWVFEFPSPVDPPIPCRGRPGLWVPPAAVAERLAGIVWPAPAPPR